MPSAGIWDGKLQRPEILRWLHERVEVNGRYLAYPVETSENLTDCAVDVNQECDAVLKAASFLAQAYHAKLCVAHIPSTTPSSSDSEASPELLQRALANVMNRENREPGIPVKVRVWNAEITQGIRVISVEEKAGLLVVGRGHDRGSVSRIWSHLYDIIRDSLCPVLSV